MILWVQANEVTWEVEANYAVLKDDKFILSNGFITVREATEEDERPEPTGQLELFPSEE